jgi:hypothetical protein
MTKEETSAAYAAYAELERAAEEFYTAADRMAKVLPAEANALYALCEAVNMQIAVLDDEFDEVL